MRARTEVARASGLHAAAMSVIDNSPGGFMAFVFGVLYGTVLVEVAMLVDGSYVVMGVALTTIVVIAALLCRWVLALMGPAVPSLDYEPQARPARAAIPAPAPARAPARIPVTRGTPVAQ